MRHDLEPMRHSVGSTLLEASTSSDLGGAVIHDCFLVALTLSLPSASFTMTLLGLSAMLLAILLFVCNIPAEAFVANQISAPRRNKSRLDAPSSAMRLSPITSLASDVAVSHSFLVSTVDADIANLSDNEFAPIFAGGILVMFGGLLSAIIVGTIVDKKDLYASIVAESYAQGGDDSEFWKGLSEEEKKKTQELLRKIKANENGAPATGEERAAASSVMSSTKSPSLTLPTQASVTTTPPSESSSVSARDQQPQDIDIFSDY